MEGLEHNKKSNSKPADVGSEYTGSLVDEAWNCGCGALNASYRETCGACDGSGITK